MNTRNARSRPRRPVPDGALMSSALAELASMGGSPRRTAERTLLCLSHVAAGGERKCDGRDADEPFNAPSEVRVRTHGWSFRSQSGLHPRQG